MRVFFPIFWFVCITCWIPPSGAVADPSLEPPVRITVIGTSDFHGALEAKNDKVVGGRAVGGIDIIAAYIQAMRAANPGGVLLLDAGDLYQGTLLSAASEGRAVIEFYNEIGYDAAAVGNHEFDFGPVGYHSTSHGPDEDPLGVLKLRIKEAKFPFLAANVYDRKTGKRVAWENLKGYAIIEKKGVKIGVIGMTAEDTPLITNPANVAGLEFRPLVDTFRKILPEVKKKGATVVVLVLHVGIREEVETGNLRGRLLDFVRELDPGEVDLVVSGHQHVPFSGKINGIPVVQTWPKGISFSRVDMVVDRSTGRVLPDQMRLHANTFFYRNDHRGKSPKYAGRIIRPSAHFVKKLEQFKRSVEHLERIELGRALQTMKHRTPLDSPVGNLVTDAMRATDKSIDVAMYNSGGLRTSILEGVVTYGRIYEVVPFDNNIMIVSLTGSHIREIVEHGLSAPYGVMEISGLRVTFDEKAKPGSRCISITMADGRPLEMDKTYTVATNDFVLSGGDGYIAFAQGTNVRNTHTLIREVVARYIKEKGVVTPDAGGRYKSCKKPGATERN